jgi:glutathione peroxidase-family protein
VGNLFTGLYKNCSHTKGVLVTFQEINWNYGKLILLLSHSLLKYYQTNLQQTHLQQMEALTVNQPKECLLNIYQNSALLDALDQKDYFEDNIQSEDEIITIDDD